MYSGQTGSLVAYDRQIRYLDYMENGQRSRGAGFVKLERRDGKCNISLQVSGLYRKDHFSRPLLMISGGKERELCKLQLADGGIKTYLEGLDSYNLDGQGLQYEQLQGLRIPISEGKEIRCMWGVMQQPDVPGAGSQESLAGRPESQDTEAEFEPMPMRNPGPETGAGTVAQVNPGPEMEPTTVHQVDLRPEMEPKTGNRTDLTSGTGQAQAVFKEDKWSQLWSIYPHIHPFSDEREYLSFGLSDFVVLSGRSYKLVHNSFLLHGFYTHQYLILTRVNQRGNLRYYIGVPGYLIDRERRIAIMFGFESFECASEPASEGDFGYYLIPVEL